MQFAYIFIIDEIHVVDLYLKLSVLQLAQVLQIFFWKIFCIAITIIIHNLIIPSFSWRAPMLMFAIEKHRI